MLSVYKPKQDVMVELTLTIDAWSKIADDIAKVAMLAIPVMLYGNETLAIKIINALLLSFSAYSALLISRHLRKSKHKQGETQ